MTRCRFEGGARAILLGHCTTNLTSAPGKPTEARASLELHAGCEHDRPPFGLLGLHEGGELIRRRRRRRGILALELLFQLGGCQARDTPPAQPGEGVPRRT